MAKGNVNPADAFRMHFICNSSMYDAFLNIVIRQGAAEERTQEGAWSFSGATWRRLEAALLSAVE